MVLKIANQAINLLTTGVCSRYKQQNVWVQRNDTATFWVWNSWDGDEEFAPRANLPVIRMSRNYGCKMNLLHDYIAVDFKEKTLKFKIQGHTFITWFTIKANLSPSTGNRKRTPIMGAFWRLCHSWEDKGSTFLSWNFRADGLVGTTCSVFVTWPTARSQRAEKRNFAKSWILLLLPIVNGSSNM